MLVLFSFFYRLDNFGDFIFIFNSTPRLYNFENFLVNQKNKKWWPYTEYGSYWMVYLLEFHQSISETERPISSFNQIDILDRRNKTQLKTDRTWSHQASRENVQKTDTDWT